VIDVDKLKVVNDSHGHPSGDDLLRAVSRLVTAEARSGDKVTRAGGDEFVVVLDSPGDRGPLELMDRVRRAAADLGASDAWPWVAGLRLSLGYASTVEGTPVELLLALADRRMYADKPRGTRGYAST
jgi:diguanylate cyclase (GGDEF)-like protein